MIKHVVIGLAGLSILSTSARAQSVQVDIPVLDAPYNVAHSLRGPSMAQSLAVTAAFYELVHPAIQKAFGSHKTAGVVGLIAFDIFGSVLPGGDAWVHEEFHRAVMGNRGIDSFDDVYLLDLSASTISVSHVKDSDLVALKAMHPAEQVRMNAAGIEGEGLLLDRLEQNAFFGGSTANHIPFYWLTKLNTIFYIASGATSEADSITDELNASDGANIPKRDFTGHDFTAWVYDLHRPTEPYAARGIHPSGVGIDRYIRMSDLSQEERDHLAYEGRLSALNFVDPNLFGFKGITVNAPFTGEPMQLNATMAHYLTSFGHSIDVNLFARTSSLNLYVTAHRYSNGMTSFPGVEARVIDVPLTVAGQTFRLTPRVALWQQPDAQSFTATSGSVGGMASLRVRQPSASRTSAFVEVDAKSAGWVAGMVSLESGVTARAGASVRLW